MNPVKHRRVATAVWLLVAISTLQAEQPRPTEYQVQAAYLYNFGKFVQWPGAATGGSTGAFTICILGDDTLGPVLSATVIGGTVGGKTVAAKRIMNAREAVNCQTLFVGSTKDTELAKILETLNKVAVLTVSDMPRFTERGGMIQFILEGNRVRFQVNLTAAQNAGLTLSSQLLKLAALVRRNAVPGE
jgi:hypothetical protein